MAQASLTDAIDAQTNLTSALHNHEQSIFHLNRSITSLEQLMTGRNGGLARCRRTERDLIRGLKDGLELLQLTAQRFPLLAFQGTHEFDRRIRSLEFKLRNSR